MRTRRWVIWCASIALMLALHAAAPIWAQGMLPADPQALREEMGKHKATCMFFFIEDCPVSMRDFSVIRTLSATYGGENIAFVGVYVGEQHARLQHIIDSLDVDIAYVDDKGRRLVAMTEAITTPEYFLFDHSGQLVYRGAIDNYAYGYARHRKRVTQQFLREAIDALLQGKRVPTAVTRPYGCVIEQSRAQ